MQGIASGDAATGMAVEKHAALASDSHYNSLAPVRLTEEEKLSVEAKGMDAAYSQLLTEVSEQLGEWVRAAERSEKQRVNKDAYLRFAGRKRKLDEVRDHFFTDGPDLKKPRPVETTAYVFECVCSALIDSAAYRAIGMVDWFNSLAWAVDSFPIDLLETLEKATRKPTANDDSDDEDSDSDDSDIERFEVENEIRQQGETMTPDDEDTEDEVEDEVESGGSEDDFEDEDEDEDGSFEL